MSLLPRIQGAGGGGSPPQPQDAADTLRSVQRAEIVDLLGEGVIGGLVNGLKSVYLDGVPVENADGSRNFHDFGMSLQLGGPTDSALLDAMGDVQTEVSVGVVVAAALPVVRTIADPTVDAIRVTLLVPGLWHVQDNGDRTGTRVEFAVDVQSAGGGFVTRFTDAIEGKTSSAYSRSIKIDLKATGAAPWDVRLRRITPDSSSSNLVNQFSWASYTALSGVRMLYRHSAAARLTFDSRNFGAVPVRSYDLMGLSDWEIPVNYDPLARTVAGLWNGTFKLGWTNNPAWVLHNLVRHRRYGMGEYAGVVPDKWTLYRLAQWCDHAVSNGRGGTEPRYTVNAYIQQRAEAVRLLQDICAIFRGALVYGGSQLSVTWDAPAVPVASYTPANVVDGLFTYADGSLAAKKSSCTCWYNDMAQQGKRASVTWDDDALVARYGMRTMEIDPLGVTSPSQALRMAKWALYSTENEDKTVSFRTGTQGASARLGEVFQVSDPSETGERLGGRVKSATASLVVLDAPVALAAGETYTLWVTLPDAADGTRLKTESRTVTSAAGTRAVLDVAPAFSMAPAAETMWLLEASTVAPTLWRYIDIQEVREGDSHVGYQITGLAHQPGKWALIEDGQPLVLRPTRRLADAAPLPLDVVVAETVYLDGSLSRHRATVSWRAPAPGLRYQVAWRARRGPWQTLAPTSGNTVDIDQPGAGLLEVQVQSLNALGRYSPAVPAAAELVAGTPYTGALDATRGADSSNLRVGLGLNLLANSDFVASDAGWSVHWVQNGGIDYTLARNLSAPDWVPAGGAQLGLRRLGNARTGFIDFGLNAAVAVRAGQRCEVSGLVASHRQDASVGVIWYDQHGGYVGETFFPAPRANGGRLLSNWARAGGFLSAPPAAAVANYRVRVLPVDPGEIDGYTWLTRGFFGEATAGQTELSAWAPSYFADPRQLGYAGDLDATRNRLFRQEADPGIAAANGDQWLRTDSVGAVVAVYWREGGTWRQGPIGPKGNFIDQVFRRAATQPASPTGNGTPSGWSDAPPAANGNPLWLATAEKTPENILVGAWSTPVKLDGDDGTDGVDGDSIEVQYSATGTGGWHFPFTAGDLFMRQRVGTGAWSAAIRIVGEGALPLARLMIESTAVTGASGTLPSYLNPAIWTSLGSLSFVAPLTGSVTLHLAGSATFSGAPSIVVGQLVCELRVNVDANGNGAPGPGNETIAEIYSLQAQPGSGRAATLTVAGSRTMTVTQGTSYTWPLYAQMLEGTVIIDRMLVEAYFTP
jgi:hypothetical protein